MGIFNTWSSGTFQSSATNAPWFEGSVVSGSGTITAPMLVPDLATATVTGNGSSVYSGSTVTNAYTTTYTMGGTTLSPNVTVTTSVGPNAGTYANTPTYSISAPTTQTSVYSVSAVSGTWTITGGGITSTNFNPVLQTVDLFQKLPSLPGSSSPGTFSNSGSFSPSSSGTSTMLDVTPDSSLKVLQPLGDDTSGDGILSAQELKQ